MSAWALACIVSWVLWPLSVFQAAGMAHHQGAQDGYDLGRRHERAGIPAVVVVRLPKRKEGTHGDQR